MRLLSTFIFINLLIVNQAIQASVGWSFTNSRNDWNNTLSVPGSNGTPVYTSLYHNSERHNGGNLTQGQVRNSGWGLQGRSNGESHRSPLHAIGNGQYNGNGSYSSSSSYSSGNFESVLFDFGENNEVSLSEICITWHKFDSDISIAAYTGNQANLNLQQQQYSELLTNGWQDVAQLSDLENYRIYNFNDANYRSRYWLIGAYNPALDSQNRGWSTGNDFFKLEYIGGNIYDCSTPGTEGCAKQNDTPLSEVSIPNTLLLVTAGLIGFSRKNSKM